MGIENDGAEMDQIARRDGARSTPPGRGMTVAADRPDLSQPASGAPVSQPDRMARLGVVIVNFRRPDDTIECLESLLRSPLPLAVVVVENGSGDSSDTAIADWAGGRRRPTAASADMAPLIEPPLPKPVPMQIITPAEIGTATPDAPLTLIRSPDNLGFAGGNNLGLRLLRRAPGLEAFWLLNNDTIVAPDTAERLLARMAATANIGMCGTVVRYYWQPNRVQALGGLRYSWATGTSRAIGGGTAASAPVDAAAVTAAIDFVLGASLAVSRPFLDAIGLMEEGYFLYFEELDWAVRNRRHSAPFVTAFAADATVWHKEGGSIGSSGDKAKRSPLSDYWLTRSRLTFARRFTPQLVPWYWLLSVGVAARRLWRRQPGKARAIGRALLGRQY